MTKKRRKNITTVIICLFFFINVFVFFKLAYHIYPDLWFPKTSGKPMGISDMGLDPETDIAYSYNTTSFMGTANILSLSVFNGQTDIFHLYSCSLQLNSVLKLRINGINYAYWVQNTIEIDTLSDKINFLCDIWNFSVSSFHHLGNMTDSFSGRGSIERMNLEDYNSDKFYNFEYFLNYEVHYPCIISLDITSSMNGINPTISFGSKIGNYTWNDMDTVTVA